MAAATDPPFERRQAIPVRKHSLLSTGDLYSKCSASSILGSHTLLVGTATNVYSWNKNGIEEIFKSGSAGIVAAKSTWPGRNLLAVADSQVLVLHDIDKGMQQSYRLKGTRGRVSRIQYDPSNSRLFFTTSLQNNVQCYSLTEESLLPGTTPHPSPLTAFAFSPQSNYLVSSSARPPCTLLTSMRCPWRFTSLQPDSTSAVVAASFHPSFRNLFALALADGALIVYRIGPKVFDLDLSTDAAGQIPVRQVAKTSGHHTLCYGDDISFSSENTVAVMSNTVPSIAVSIAFVPGQRQRLVTAGLDGRCNMLEITDNGEILVRKRWSMKHPVYSVAASDCRRTSVDTTSSWSCLLAFGLPNGQVALCSSDGDFLAMHAFPTICKVTSLEWRPHTDCNNIVIQRTRSVGLSAKRDAPKAEAKESTQNARQSPSMACLLHPLLQSDVPAHLKVAGLKLRPTTPDWRYGDNRGSKRGMFESPAKSSYHTPGEISLGQTGSGRSTTSPIVPPRRESFELLGFSQSMTGSAMSGSAPVQHARGRSCPSPSRAPVNYGRPRWNNTDTEEAYTPLGVHISAAPGADPLAFRRSLTRDAAIADTPESQEEGSIRTNRIKPEGLNIRKVQQARPTQKGKQAPVPASTQVSESTKRSSDIVISATASTKNNSSSKRKTRNTLGNSAVANGKPASELPTPADSAMTSGEASSEIVPDWTYPRPRPLQLQPTGLSQSNRKSIFQRHSQEPQELVRLAKLSRSARISSHHPLPQPSVAELADCSESSETTTTPRPLASGQETHGTSSTSHSSITHLSILQEIRSVRRELLAEIRGQRPWLESLSKGQATQQAPGINRPTSSLQRELDLFREGFPRRERSSHIH